MSQANITDVAKAANVSVATVSRALNEPEKVSSETQNRIKEAIRELNYRPNRLGVRLRKQKTNVLLVLVSDLGNPFFSDILYGMDETAQKHGYSLMVVSTYFNTERERSSLLALEQRTVDGAVLLSSMLPTEEINYYDAHFPIIQCCDFNEDSTAMHVSIDNYKATEQVVEYFLALGRKRIAAIGLSNNFISSRLRAKAYRETLERHGIAFEPDMFQVVPHTFEYGITATQVLLRLPEPPDAIFCMSDIIAAGAVRALADAGIRVPEDVALIGFDNVVISKIITPPLSTVGQPMRQIGNTAIEALIERMKGHPVTKEIYLDHELILRKTT